MAKYHLRTTEKEIELPFIESGIPSIWDRLPNNTIEMEYHQQNFTKTIQPKPLTTKKFKLLSNQKLFTRNKIHFWQTKNNVTKCQCHNTNDDNYTYNNKYNNNNNNSSSNSIKDNNRNFCFSIKSNNIIPTTSFLTSCCCCSQSIKYPKNQIEPTTSSTSSSSSYSSLSSTLQSSPLTKNPNINFIIPVNKTRISNLVMQNIINFNNKAITTILLTRLKLISLAKKRINSFNLQLYWWQQKQFLWIILFILFGLLSKCSAIRQDAAQECIFPQRWEGSWFLSGYQQSIHIKGSQFSYRGKCKASDGNKYLIVDEKGCHRCLVIYEKHKNVLQYKESECEGDSMYMDQSMNPAAMPMRSIVKSDHNRGGGGAHPNMNGHSRLSSSDQYIMRSNDDSNDCFCRGREILQNLCDQIPGDALLYSLFREQAEPVKCPLKGPFTFTYNRGHGECKNPVSNIESCTDESRLLLNFQACPDVQGTESAAEELTCLATWKDGNSRYLVGLVSHHHAISNEERFRCFVYEKISSMMGAFPGSFSSPSLKDAEYKLAQSGDATCNGLDSAEVGSRIMTLRKPPPAERCDFPTWFKGPRHWHGLMAKSQYIFHPSDGSMQIKKPNGNMETRAFCEQINKQTATEMMAVVHHTTGCQSGFMCMMFYRRDTHITEIQTGTPANRLEDACAPDHFDITKLQYVTLLANNPEPQICPLDGLYTLKGAIGPPHKISRHKRNHNNKGHYQHNHHHHDLLGVKRHGTFNLHISDENEQPSPSTLSSSSSSSSLISSQMATIVQSNTNRLLIRNRRTVTTTPPINHNIEELSSKSILNLPLKNSINNNDGDDNNNNSNNVGSGDVIKKFSTISSIPIIATESIDNNDHLNGNIIKESTKLKLSVKHISTNLNDVTSVSNSNKILSQPQYKMENLSSSSSLLQSIVSIKNSQSIEILNQRNRRETPGCIVNNKDQRKLWIGCTEPNIIDVRPQCNEDGDEVYYCHGSWNENGTVYIIAKHSGTQHGVCITYQLLDGKDAKLIVGDSCVRAPMKPAEHHLVANIKNIGKCGDPNSSVKYTINIFILLTAIGFTILNSKS